GALGLRRGLWGCGLKDRDFGGNPLQIKGEDIGLAAKTGLCLSFHRFPVDHEVIVNREASLWRLGFGNGIHFGSINLDFLERHVAAQSTYCADVRVSFLFERSPGRKLSLWGL